MILGDIIESIRSLSAKTTTNDQVDRIVYDVNRVYRSLARKGLWPQLTITGTEFTTEDGVDTYTLPYPLEEILDGSLQYDVSASSNWPVRQLDILRNTGTIGVLEATTPNIGYWPLAAMMVGGTHPYAAITETSGTEANGSTAIGVVDETNFEAGQWIVFSAGTVGSNVMMSSPGDYAYQIASVAAGSLTISEPYRGPTLPLGTIIRANPPAYSIKLIPDYTEFGKTVRYNWQRRPRRLFNAYEAMEVGALGDAVIFTVLAENPQYHRPDSYDAINLARTAKGHLRDAMRGNAVTYQQ